MNMTILLKTRTWRLKLRNRIINLKMNFSMVKVLKMIKEEELINN